MAQPVPVCKACWKDATADEKETGKHRSPVTLFWVRRRCWNPVKHRDDGAGMYGHEGCTSERTPRNGTLKLSGLVPLRENMPLRETELARLTARPRDTRCGRVQRCAARVPLLFGMVMLIPHPSDHNAYVCPPLSMQSRAFITCVQARLCICSLCARFFVIVVGSQARRQLTLARPVATHRRVQLVPRRLRQMQVSALHFSVLREVLSHVCLTMLLLLCPPILLTRESMFAQRK